MAMLCTTIALTLGSWNNGPVACICKPRALLIADTTAAAPQPLLNPACHRVASLTVSSAAVTTCHVHFLCYKQGCLTADSFLQVALRNIWLNRVSVADSKAIDDTSRKEFSSEDKLDSFGLVKQTGYAEPDCLLVKMWLPSSARAIFVSEVACPHICWLV